LLDLYAREKNGNARGANQRASEAFAHTLHKEKHNTPINPTRSFSIGLSAAVDMH